MVGLVTAQVEHRNQQIYLLQQTLEFVVVIHRYNILEDLMLENIGAGFFNLLAKPDDSRSQHLQTLANLILSGSQIRKK